MYFKSTNNKRIRLWPVIYIVFEPELPSHNVFLKFFCRSKYSIYVSEKKSKREDYTTMNEDDRLVECFMGLWWASTRNSLKAKSKANNQTHVLKLFSRRSGVAGEKQVEVEDM